MQSGHIRVVQDLTAPEFQGLLATDRAAIHGFTELDKPNFSFRQPPCSFYSATKALAEEALVGVAGCYIWRLRIPFDEFENPRNYLTKLQRYPKVYDNVNSLSHRRDYVTACLDLWDRRAPFGTYNITNPGYVTTREVVAMIQRVLKPARKFEFWKNDHDFYQHAARTPRSNCIMDVSKILSVGVKIRPVGNALEEALVNWKV